MTREEMEKEAREAAEEHRSAIVMGGGSAERVSGEYDGYLDGYKEAAEPRERELERLRAELASERVQNKDLASDIHGWMRDRDNNQREIAALRAELADWRESARKASGERCEDEIHCCCVPYLRVEIAALRARVAELEGLVPRECPECSGSGSIESTGSEHSSDCDGSCRNCPVPVQVIEPCAMCGSRGIVMVPPIPLPEGE